MTDYDDLIGGDTPAPKRGRPTNEERQRRADAMLADAVRQAEIKRAGAGMAKIAVEELKFLPVSQNWLCNFFSMDPQTARKRLRNCPVAGRAGANREVYLFHEAIPYLIKPKMTAEQFAKTLNKADLPPEINNAFWNAQRARVRYKLEAQEAWDTEDVLRFLGETAMTLKDALTMSVEEMRQRAKLTDQQAELFEKMLDEMREDIVGKLLALADDGDTDSLFDQPLFGVSEAIDTTPEMPDWSGDDD